MRPRCLSCERPMRVRLSEAAMDMWWTCWRCRTGTPMDLMDKIPRLFTAGFSVEELAEKYERATIDAALRAALTS